MPLPSPARAQAAPPAGFPFYGLTPAMLRAMGNPAQIQGHLLSAAAGRQQAAQGVMPAQQMQHVPPPPPQPPPQPPPPQPPPQQRQQQEEGAADADRSEWG